jgi:hypothetical protein
MSLFTRIKFWAIQQADSGSVLLGRRSGSAGDFEEITLGSNLSMNGSTLNATGGGSPTGSFTGSFTGSLFGTSSWAVSSSQAVSASWAPSTPSTLQFFSESRNTATPNATVPAHIFQATGSETNIDMVLLPKGTGALILDIPDATAAGGNKRGLNSVDLQMNRSAANQVASGQYGAILSGDSNRNVAYAGAIVGGSTNIIQSGAENFIGAGNNNNITDTGAGNNQSVIVGGQANTSFSGRSFIGSGNANVIREEYGVIVNGQFGLVGLYAQESFAPGRFVSGETGGVQRSIVTAWRSIAGTASANLFLNGSNSRITLVTANTGLSNKVYGFKTMLVAVCKTSGGSINANDVWGATYEGIIKRVGTTTSLVGSVNTINSWADGGFSGNTPTVAITADDTNEALDIQFTIVGGNASTNVRVNATIHLTELGW